MTLEPRLIVLLLNILCKVHNKSSEKILSLYQGQVLAYKYTPQTSLQLSNSTSSTKLPPHYSQTSNSITSKNLCVDEWISYWRENLKDSIYAGHLPVLDDEELRSLSSSKDSSQNRCKTVFEITTVETLTTSLSSLCDGFPRAQSVGETTRTYTESRPSRHCTTQYTKSEDYWNNRWYGHEEGDDYSWYGQGEKKDKLSDAPRCQVPPSECAESWARYLDQFRFGVCYDDLCLDHDHLSLSPFQISQWKSHLFVNCKHVLPRLRAWLLVAEGRTEFLNGTLPSELENLSEQEVDKAIDGYYSCNVMVDSFVLFHFPLAIPTTRDICTNSGYGEFFSYVPLYASTNPALAAIVTAATFGIHDLRLEDELIGKYANYLA
jgi:hypothetical protein